MIDLVEFTLQDGRKISINPYDVCDVSEPEKWPDQEGKRVGCYISNGIKFILVKEEYVDVITVLKGIP